jgi:hypothetical protein
MMPHPERAADPLLRRVDGRQIFASIIAYTLGREAAGSRPVLEHAGR